MNESQEAAIVRFDQLEIASQSSPDTQEAEQRPKWKWKRPRISNNHVTAMMVVCLAISCFITVFSLLMLIVPFLSEYAKYREFAKNHLEWNDRSVYLTSLYSNKSRSKRSLPSRMDLAKAHLGRFKRNKQCYDVVHGLSKKLYDMLQDPAHSEVQMERTYVKIKDIYDECVSKDKTKTTIEGGPRDRPSRNLTSIENPLSGRKAEEKPESIRGKTNENFVVTGPEGYYPGEAIKTSQRMVVSLPQVMQQTCVLKSTPQQFPPSPPTYVCYSNDDRAKGAADQGVHIPTAVSSPNPYYFPTVSGSPVINPVYESKPSFNPSTGTVHLSPDIQEQHVPTIHFQQAALNPFRPPMRLQFPSFYWRPNAIPQWPTLPQQVDPYLMDTGPPVGKPVYQPLTLHPGSQVQVQCSYHPATGSPYQVINFPPVTGVSETSRSSASNNTNLTKYQPVSKSAGYSECSEGEVSCQDDEGSCVAASSLCDSKVDCKNARDELGCSCTQRIPKVKHCDGIEDCPDSSDENYCHGCGFDMFSCEDADRGLATCLPIEAKCDGVRQCSNGKDESDCFLLADSFYNHKKSFVSYSEGYLHHNWRGVWYPVCLDRQQTSVAHLACTAEQGFTHFSSPTIIFTKKPKDYTGNFFHMSKSKIFLDSNCHGDMAVFIRCPASFCGRQSRHYQRLDLIRSYRKANGLTSSTISSTRPQNYTRFSSTHQRNPRNQEGRVVGGWKSEPGRWPWLVAIYRDGIFHCGGVIIDSRHILTAAHCFSGYKNYYYEVHAGILRRLSFSPQQQIIRVDKVFIHHRYDSTTMQNDLCLIRLEDQLKMNRWVTPVCLPPAGALFPQAGDTCTAVGWGATYEHGPDPDHMHEVDVPILSSCKRQEDRDAEEICAGAIEGGRDTCQGDSGGPLLCRSSLAWGPEWYVSGIVSHGEGCARPGEPGAYTRVSLYVHWIDRILRSEIDGGYPLNRCPGKQCYDKQCIAIANVCDGTVDCLFAEDEVDCYTNKNGSSESLALFHEVLPVLRQSSFNATLNRWAYTSEKRTSDGDSLSIPKKYFPPIIPTKPPSATVPTEHTTSSTNMNDPEGVIKTVLNNSSRLDSIRSKNFTAYTAAVHSDKLSTNISELKTPNQTTMASIVEKSSSDGNTLEEKTMHPIKVISSIPVHSANNSSGGQLLHLFSCNNFSQRIKHEYYCDGIVDCEDGSDELNCTCKDHLQHLNQQLVCDSSLDCLDKTDEDSCTDRCQPGQVYLSRSKICIDERLRCNFVQDFPSAEDEQDCYFLVPNVTNLQPYKDGTVHPSVRGLLMRIQAGIPYPIPICSPFKYFHQLYKRAVKFLGFQVWKWLIPVKFPGIPPANCTGLYGVVENHPRFSGFSPWLASISVDGRYFGSAVLIDPSWVLTSHRPIFNNIKKMNESCVSSRVGALSVSKWPGPPALYQEESRVDKAVTIPGYHLTLLRLQNPVVISKAVKPLTLLKNIKRDSSDKCYAVGLVSQSKVLVNRAVRVSCQGNRTCYNVINRQPFNTSNYSDCSGDSCGNDGSEINCSEKWSGAIWCQDENSHPYLDCLFDKRQVCCGPCSIACTPVLHHYRILSALTEMYETPSNKNKTLKDGYFKEDLENLIVLEGKRLFTRRTREQSGEERLDDPLGHNLALIPYSFDKFLIVNNASEMIEEKESGENYSRFAVKNKEKFSKRSHPMHNPFGDTIHLTVQETREEIVDDYYNNHRNAEWNNYDDYNDRSQLDWWYQNQEHFKRSVGKSTKFDYDRENTTRNIFDRIKETKISVLDVGKGMECNGPDCDQILCTYYNRSTSYWNNRNGNTFSDEPRLSAKHSISSPDCKNNEISCGDGFCISAEKFCDGTADCVNKIDEPKSCSKNCSSYFALKRPSWLCDGNPNCLDGSDESWETCGLFAHCSRPGSFVCKRSSGCIHQYQVCDGIKDCPHGEDEQTCAAIRSQADSLWKGQLFKHVLGQWVPSCLEERLSEAELDDICHSLRRTSADSARYKIISTTQPELEPFSSIRLNNGTEYSVLNRPTVVQRRKHDCLTLHITCQ